MYMYRKIVSCKPSVQACRKVIPLIICTYFIKRKQFQIDILKLIVCSFKEQNSYKSSFQLSFDTHINMICLPQLSVALATKSMLKNSFATNFYSEQYKMLIISAWPKHFIFLILYLLLQQGKQLSMLFLKHFPTSLKGFWCNGFYVINHGVHQRVACLHQ